jgi:hypothetical protein
MRDELGIEAAARGLRTLQHNIQDMAHFMREGWDRDLPVQAYLGNLEHPGSHTTLGLPIPVLPGAIAN